MCVYRESMVCDVLHDKGYRGREMAHSTNKDQVKASVM